MDFNKWNEYLEYRNIFFNYDSIGYDNLLYALALRYEYECERYDAFIVQTRYREVKLRNERVYLPSYQDIKNSNEFAKEQRDQLKRVLLILGCEWQYYRSISKNVDRLSYYGLINEYENMPQDLMEQLKRLF